MSGERTRGETHKGFKWGTLYCGVGVGIVSKLCKGKKGSPVGVMHVTEGSEELF